MSVLNHIQKAIGEIQEALSETHSAGTGKRLLHVSHLLQEVEEDIAREGEDQD
jgi:hypothetical protein